MAPHSLTPIKVTAPTSEGVPLFQLLREDLQAVFNADPASKSLAQVFFFSAGLHIVWAYRWQHWLWQHNLKILAHLSHRRTQRRYAADIHPAARIGRRFAIDHGVGVVIGETAIVGDDCMLYQGVTLGMTGKRFTSSGKRHPTVGSGVMIGAGAIILGDIELGDRCHVGAGCVVVKPVPERSTVVGMAAHLIGDKNARPADDANWGILLGSNPELKARLDALSREFGVNTQRADTQHVDTQHVDAHVVDAQRADTQLVDM